MSKYVIIPDENFLMHHGIKGQKWGVRRFQNLDGTRTAAGKNRYGSNSFNNKSNEVSNKNALKKEQKEIRKAEKQKQKEIEKWTQDVEQNWYKSYNKASDIINKELVKINNNPKYSDEALDDPKIYKEYVDLIDKTWRKIYTDQLKKDFGDDPDPDSDPTSWVEEVPFFNMYDDYSDVLEK